MYEVLFVYRLTFFSLVCVWAITKKHKTLKCSTWIKTQMVLVCLGNSKKQKGNYTSDPKPNKTVSKRGHCINEFDFEHSCY